ncbi:hypothetical protein AVEN_205511-1 [Araneus ventricosus]|uniref:Uncharacterized protein n=1 Tax=Araneus ventricosus TaxID=182803 RepID=A0A4Y2RUZ1_ARAVE|nr:hypothetical protein AVEN_205511-1 [Araneus ventricosus]
MHLHKSPQRILIALTFWRLRIARSERLYVLLPAVPFHTPLRGTSSLDVTGFTTPRYPSVYFSFRFCLPLSFFAIFFFPSRVGEGALHEKLSPLCLLPASHGQQITPTCWPCVATHLTGGTFWSPVYQSAGIPVAWLVCSRGSSEGVTPWAWR